MKKKELKKRIKDLQQLTDCLISDNVRLLMRLGEMPCEKHEDKYPKQTMTSFPDTPACTPSQLEEAERRIFAKTEGPESESELKENTISLEVGKKYLTKNGYKLICKEIDVYTPHSHEYIMTFEDGTGHMWYSKKGIVCNGVNNWDIVSEVKE